MVKPQARMPAGGREGLGQGLRCPFHYREALGGHRTHSRTRGGWRLKSGLTDCSRRGLWEVEA